jgi:hypothetical protein
MHFPKAARLTLQGLFKIPPEFFIEMEKIDIAEIQAGIATVVRQVQLELPELIARQTRIETALLSLLSGQDRIEMAIDRLAESVHIEQGGLPDELPSASAAWEGKDEMQHALEAQTENMP